MSDLVTRDHQEQSAEQTPGQGGQDQDGGPQAAGEEHAGEPGRDGHMSHYLQGHITHYHQDHMSHYHGQSLIKCSPADKEADEVDCVKQSRLKNGFEKIILFQWIH